MKLTVSIVVVIPIGPRTSVEFVIDTINSFVQYTASSYKIILVDDSQRGVGTEVKRRISYVDVIYTEKPMGGWAGLYISLSLAFRHAIERYRFQILLKLDTDALVIGPQPEKEALFYFAQNPYMGMAGQYPLDFDGEPWDKGWPRKRILNGVNTWKFIRRPVANWILRKLYNRAVKNGYKTGESVFGGAYFMSESLLIELDRQNLLPNYRLKSLNLGEDHLFSLLTKTVGYELGNLASENMPFGCAWKGLPASPEQLYKLGKKIIHSTSYWREMQEKDIRAFFRIKRQQYAAQGF